MQSNGKAPFLQEFLWKRGFLSFWGRLKIEKAGLKRQSYETGKRLTSKALGQSKAICIAKIEQAKKMIA
jgi:hypothetical protein